MISDATSFTEKSMTANTIGEEIVDMMASHAWTEEQAQKSAMLRFALATAIKAVVELVPPSADRSAAIRKIREAAWSCNAAITFNGRY